MRTPLAVLLLISALHFPGGGSAADTVPSPTIEAAPTERAANAEIKQALARFAQERNEIGAANEKLRDQRWLLAIYAGVMTLIAGWLGLRLLSRPRISKEGVEDAGTVAVAADGGTATATRRRNATITIRNGATQQAEVVERVETRRYFNRGDTATLAKRSDTATLAKRSDTATPTPRTGTRTERRTETHTAPETSDPTPMPTPMAPVKPSARRTESPPSSLPSEMRPATVRVEHRSDRLEQVPLKPGTGAIGRTTTRKAFTLIEVMISVAVLATVLMAAFSGSYTLRQVQRASQEQTQVEELAASVAERIMGANWDWLGRNRPNDGGIDYRKGAWSWHRRENSQTYTGVNARFLTEDAANPDNDLVAVGLLQQKTGIRDLKLYLEYYHASALDEVFNAGNGQAPHDRWQAMQRDPVVMREYILPESEQAMDLREETKAVVVRILITWDSYLGGARRHELVFARRK